MTALGDITKTCHWTSQGSLPSQIHQWCSSGVYVFQGPYQFTCQKESLAQFLVCNEQQGFEVPAKKLDKALSYEKHCVCIVLTHHSQVLVCEMNVFR